MLERPGRPESVPKGALASVRIDWMPIAHQDNRRIAVEIFSAPGITIRDSKVLVVNQPKEGEETIIGGHWEKGLEIIYVQAGEISTLRLADVQTGDEGKYDNLLQGTRIMMPSGIAHQLRFRNSATLMIFNEIPYSPDKLVIYPPWADELRIDS